MNELLNARLPGLGLAPAPSVEPVDPRARDALLRDAIAAGDAVEHPASGGLRGLGHIVAFRRRSGTVDLRRAAASAADTKAAGRPAASPSAS
jgi:hypothetical protein